MMENAALGSLEGNTAQRDLGSCSILKAGFFFVKWIHLALLPAVTRSPLAGWADFIQSFQLCVTLGLGSILATRARAGPAEMFGALQGGEGEQPLVCSGAPAQPQNVMTASESKKRAGNSLSLKKDTQILSFPLLSLFLEGILEI